MKATKAQLAERARVRARAWYAKNHDEALRRDRARRAADPDRAYATWGRAYWLRQQHGLTPAQYEDMVVAQENLCAICGAPERSTRNGRVVNLAVDHDHLTGATRGLLCAACNRVLGAYEKRQFAIHSYLARTA